MILFLMACPVAMSNASVYPTYEFKCEHLFTPYEANIRLSIYDDFDWDTVAIDLDQEENSWSTQISRNPLGAWSATMNLMEFDCYSDYELAIYFVTSESSN